MSLPRHKLPSTVCGVVCIVSIVGLVLSCYLSIGVWRNDYDYGVMVDAGSSHTSIFVYTWPHRADSQRNVTNLDIHEVEGSVMTVRKGISTLVDHPVDVETLLRSLLDHAIEYMPFYKYKTTPVFLKATAGMRLLTKEEQELILTHARKALRASGLRFEDDWAHVIPGEDEGVFGWVTANFLLGRLGNRNALKTVGAMDLGGASLEITLLPHDIPKVGLYNLVLDGITYPLFTWSYLGLGVNQAQEHLRGFLPAEPVVEDPCYLSGYTTQWDDGRNVTGGGDFDGCQALAYQVCNITSTGYIDGIPVPPDVSWSEFYAFSVFDAMTEFLKLGDTPTWSEIAEKGQEWCRIPFDEARSRYPDVPVSRILVYCFDAAYTTELFHEGWHIPSTSRRVHHVRTVNGQTAGWTLGGMIYEAGLLSWGDKEQRRSHETLEKTAGGRWLLGVSIFLLIVSLGSFLFFFVRERLYKERSWSLITPLAEGDHHEYT